MKTRGMLVWKIVWVGIAMYLGVASLSGGEAAIAATLGHLIWTLPASMFLYFHNFEWMGESFQTSTFHFFGMAITNLAAYLFWFNVFPWLSRRLDHLKNRWMR